MSNIIFSDGTTRFHKLPYPTYYNYIVSCIAFENINSRQTDDAYIKKFYLNSDINFRNNKSIVEFKIPHLRYRYLTIDS